jgi:hypothetical protein
VFINGSAVGGKVMIMGLDQYAFAVRPNKGNTDFAWAWNDEVQPENGEGVTEIAYWRKHPNLQGFMEALWLRKRAEQGDPVQPETEGWFAGEVVFNCQPLRLTWQDIQELEKAVLGEELPATEGFFFGGDSDDYYRDQDLEFITKAKQILSQDMEIYYNSWW